MNKIRRVYQYIKDKYALLALKKYTTIAGTLVFFLIMSIVPLTFWLTLLVGKFPVDTTRLLRLPVFESVQEIFSYVQTEARNATTGASAILLITTLYSSTTLFYQMRLSGEIIYEFPRPKRGLRVRLSAFVLLLIVMLVALTLAAVLAIGTFLFASYLSSRVERLADYALLLVVAFGLTMLLNAYICPYKAPLKRFLPGALLTVAAWGVAVFGFSAYLKIGNVGKLYGALSTIIVFLLWLYVMMICFIAGVIFNSESIVAEHKQLRIKSAKYRKINSMKKTTLKSSLLVGIFTLAFCFPACGKATLPEITKPYVGEYECKSATLGEKEYLDEFSFVRLELRPDDTFTLSYASKDGKKGEETGKYAYDFEKESITFVGMGDYAIERTFPIKNGQIDVTFAIGRQTLHIRFAQK